MRKRIRVICMLCFMFCSIIPIKAEENNFGQNVNSAYVMEYGSEKIVFEKNATDKMYPASMTKMMSLILVYDALNTKKIKYDDIVTASAYAASMGGSQIFLEQNEKMNVMDLLKSICIASANDAMVALAEFVHGSEENFVSKMNEMAKTLKLENSHFTNTTGLHDVNHYSCAKDMALISKKLMEVGGEDVLKITSTYEDYIRQDKEQKFWLVNTNKLIRQYEGVDGLKTGYTSEAKSCISVSAKRNNIRFIVVVMGADDSKTRNAEVKRLLDYSFNVFDQTCLFKKGEEISVEVNKHANPEKITLVCEEDVNVVIEKGATVNVKSNEIEWLNKALPYKKGERVAILHMELNNGEKHQTYLVTSTKIAKKGYLDMFFEIYKAFL